MTCARLLCLALVLFVPVVTSAAKPTFQSIERMARTDPKAAAEALSKATFDKGTRQRLSGVIAFARGDFAQALGHFEKALNAVATELRKKDHTLQLYIAHCAVLAKKYARALVAIKLAEPLATKSASVGLIRARAHIGLGQLGQAREALDQTQKLHAERSDVLIERLALEQRLGLLASLRALARPMIDRLEKDRKAFDSPKGSRRSVVLALMKALHRDRRALALLERLAHLAYDDAEVLAHLAYAYVEQHQHRSAAKLFERATWLGGDYAHQAADQFRVAGEYRQAYTLNGWIRSAEKRLPQRLSIAFEAGQFNRALALEPLLKRAGLLKGRARYLIGYAYYAAGRVVAARKVLSKISAGSSYKSAADSLLRSMGRGPR